MSIRVEFNEETSWSGGFYELSLEYPQVGTQIYTSILQTIWSHPHLDGPFEPGSTSFDNPFKVVYDPTNPIEKLFGFATLADGSVTTFGTLVFEYEYSIQIDLFFPLGGLGQIYDVGGFPFGQMVYAGTWREKFDQWLFQLALWIYEVIPFRLALIGFDVAGEPELTSNTRIGSSDRHFGYVQIENEIPFFYPPNR